MNKSQELTNILEKILNPEKGTPEVGYSYSKSTHDALAEESSKVISPNNDDSPHALALIRYTGGHYRDINGLLRKTKKSTSDMEYYNRPSEAKKDTISLKELTKNKTKHSFNLYRGIQSDDRTPIPVHKKNDLIKDHAFTSGSLSSTTANSFAGRPHTEDDTSRLYRIKVKKGTKGIYASGHKYIDPAEREFILHPGTTFRVGNTSKHPDGTVFTDLHIHHQED